MRGWTTKVPTGKAMVWVDADGLMRSQENMLMGFSYLDIGYVCILNLKRNGGGEEGGKCWNVILANPEIN